MHITRLHIPKGLVLMPTTVETFEAQMVAKCVVLLDKQLCLDMPVYAVTVWCARDVTT